MVCAMVLYSGSALASGGVMPRSTAFNWQKPSDEGGEWLVPWLRMFMSASLQATTGSSNLVLNTGKAWQGFF